MKSFFNTALPIGLFLAFLAFSSCEQTAAKKGEGKVDKIENASKGSSTEKEPLSTEQLTGHIFGHHESSIKLPSFLKQVSAAQYDKLSANASSLNKKRVAPLIDIKRLKKEASMFLVAPKGLSIAVLAEERATHMELESNEAGRILGFMQAELQALYPGAKMEKIEAKLKKFDRTDYCKGKYKITYGGMTFYQTSYFISSDETVSDRRTLMMHVNSKKESDDLEKYIVEMSIK